MTINPNSLAARVLSDPSASYWIKDALRAALARDIVNALHDAETLADAMKDYYQIATRSS